MRLLYAALCESARERPDGRLDVHGVFHDLFAPGFPAEQTDVELLVVLEWSPAEAGSQPFSIDVLDPAGSPVGSVNGETQVRTPVQPGVPARTTIIARLDRMVFPQAGTYELVLEAAGERRPLLPLHLVLHSDAR